MKTKVVINDSREPFGISRKGLLALRAKEFPLDCRNFSGSGYAVEDFEPVLSDRHPGLLMHKRYPVLLEDGILLEARSVESNAVLRSHPALVEMVDELGAASYFPHCRHKVVELPEGVPYRILQEHGRETLEAFDPARYVVGYASEPSSS